MYTYVFAYYLKKNNQSVIFEVSYGYNCPYDDNKRFIGSWY